VRPHGLATTAPSQLRRSNQRDRPRFSGSVRHTRDIRGPRPVGPDHGGPGAGHCAWPGCSSTHGAPWPAPSSAHHWSLARRSGRSPSSSSSSRSPRADLRRDPCVTGASSTSVWADHRRAAASAGIIGRTVGRVQIDLARPILGVLGPGRHRLPGMSFELHQHPRGGQVVSGERRAWRSRLRERRLAAYGAVPFIIVIRRDKY